MKYPKASNVKMRLLLLLLLHSGTVLSLHCDKQFDYNDNYGHGFDIICHGITKEYLHVLSNITINNEISLTIGNSTLVDVTADIFHNVHLVRRLHIENSTFSYPRGHEIFRLLSNLEILVVRNTSLAIDEKTFDGLGNVREVTLEKNNLTGIGSLVGLESLRSLSVSRNRIVDIKKLGLCDAQELRLLDLSYNQIRSLADDDFRCSHANQVMDFNLNDHPYSVNVAQHDYASITEYDLELTHLDLSSNRIADLTSSLAPLKFLRVLNLSNNSLVRLGEADLGLQLELEELYLRDNRLAEVDAKVFEGKVNLEHLDLSGNALTGFGVAELPSLRYLNLGHNRLNAVMFLTGVKLKSLVTLMLNDNSLGRVQSGVFKNSPALTDLDLSHNQITLEPASFEGLYGLNNLLLSNNTISYFPRGIFNYTSTLRLLDLSRNQLRQINDTTIFQNLKMLEVLNISFNFLEDISYDLLRPLGNLHVLDVSGNKLKYIQYDVILSNLPLLSVLNIKSNLLTCELLSKIIIFLKGRNVSYTMTEKFDFTKENVAGITCTNEHIDSSAIVSTPPAKRSTLVDLGIGVLIVALLAGMAVGMYRFHVFLKRRKYRADEFELIDE